MPGADAPAPVELTAALGALAPPGVRVGCRVIDAGDLDTLFAVEAYHVRRAVTRRRQQFASGRALLRDLIGQAVALPAAPDRSPILPHGVRASLAHDDELVVAAVSTDPDVVAMGIDMEPVQPIEAAIAAVVLRADEANVDPGLAFVMKEATYKAWSALGGRILEHHDVRVQPAGSSFRAQVIDAEASFRGVWTTAAGRWLALVVVRQGEEPLDAPGAQ